MSETGPQETPRRKRRFGIWMLLSLAVLAGLGGLAVLIVTGRMLALPVWITERMEAQINAVSAPLSVEVGAVDLFFSQKGVPQVHFSHLRLSDPAGRPIALLPEASVTLDTQALLSGQLGLKRIALVGAQLTLRRAPDGAFDLALGDQVTPVSHAESLGDVLDGIDRVLAHPVLAPIEGVSAERLALTYEDARAGRVWRVEDGLLTLDQSPQDVAMRLFFSLRNDRDVPSEVALNFETVKGSPETRISANFSDVASVDIATQSPALAILTVIDAPISGALRSGISATGDLAPLSAALEIGEGALRPAEGTAPIRFSRGKTYFSYAPQTQKVTVDDFEVDTDVVRIRAEGHSYLRDQVDGWPSSMVSQFRFREVELDPKGLFEQPAHFTGGALDLKVTLDPFEVRIGQAVLTDDTQVAYRGKGVVLARPEGWQVDVDLALDEISNTRLLALWPVSVVPKTREWIAENVLSGQFYDVNAALRLAPGAEPRMTLSHEFRDSTVRFLKTMPPIEGGSGYATILDKSFTLVAEQGQVTAPSGGKIDVAGSSMRVADITVKPADAEISLHTDSAVGDILSILDLPPLQLMQKAGQPVTLADGRAVMDTKLALPLIKNVKTQDVAYQVAGKLLDMRSEVLVKGRVLAARELALRADDTELSISGGATLDGVPLRGTWSQPLGPDKKGRSTVEGTIELSQRAVDAFNIGLPKGSVSGAGVGNIRIDLAKDAAPRFRLSSDLNRIGLRLSDLGWSKARNATGTLQVAGALSAPPVIEQLDFSAPGLSASGRVTIAPNGTLQQARLDRVKLGGWLDAPVVLTGQGRGVPPAVAISGGTVDLRAKTLGGGGGGSGQAVQVALDRLIVSKGIQLSGVNGTLSMGAGTKGTLTGRVVGGAAIRADLSPAAGGTAIRVTSQDAGGVLRGAGIFEKSRGGTLDMTLTPNGAVGHYRGKLSIKNTRVKGAPVLAELLNAISVIGLIEQLGGSGLAFSDVSGNFLLTPEGLQIKKGAAIGPSMGISLAGLYMFDTNRLKMQGVISPIYMLNGIGSIFTRKGEGLFGFNYKLKGQAADPKVSVNPLSILTPGMFREIFRGPAPELNQ